MRNSWWILALMLVSCAVLNAQSPDPKVNKLSPMLGKWEGEGTQTQGADAGKKVVNKRECRWSPDQDFLICEYTTVQAAGTFKQIVVFGYDAKSNAYFFQMAAPGATLVGTTKMEINGNTWASVTTFERRGMGPIMNRAHTVFSGPGSFTVTSENSTDGGQNWTPSITMTFKKVAG